jgi:methylenetetrahydrofolate reductase (NADPH)
VKAEGVRIGTEMCKALLEGGAPGLHFYTLNLENVRLFDGLRLCGTETVTVWVCCVR